MVLGRVRDDDATSSERQAHTFSRPQFSLIYMHASTITGHICAHSRRARASVTDGWSHGRRSVTRALNVMYTVSGLRERGNRTERASVLERDDRMRTSACK